MTMMRIESEGETYYIHPGNICYLRKVSGKVQIHMIDGTVFLTDRDNMSVVSQDVRYAVAG